MDSPLKINLLMVFILIFLSISYIKKNPNQNIISLASFKYYLFFSLSLKYTQHSWSSLCCMPSLSHFPSLFPNMGGLCTKSTQSSHFFICFLSCFIRTIPLIPAKFNYQSSTKHIGLESATKATYTV